MFLCIDYYCTRFIVGGFRYVLLYTNRFYMYILNYIYILYIVHPSGLISGHTTMNNTCDPVLPSCIGDSQSSDEEDGSDNGSVDSAQLIADLTDALNSLVDTPDGEEFLKGTEEKKANAAHHLDKQESCTTSISKDSKFEASTSAITKFETKTLEKYPVIKLKRLDPDIKTYKVMKSSSSANTFSIQPSLHSAKPNLEVLTKAAKTRPWYEYNEDSSLSDISVCDFSESEETEQKATESTSQNTSGVKPHSHSQSHQSQKNDPTTKSSLPAKQKHSSSSRSHIEKSKTVLKSSCQQESRKRRLLSDDGGILQAFLNLSEKKAKLPSPSVAEVKVKAEPTKEALPSHGEYFNHTLFIYI